MLNYVIYEILYGMKCFEKRYDIMILSNFFDFEFFNIYR